MQGSERLPHLKSFILCGLNLNMQNHTMIVTVGNTRRRRDGVRQVVYRAAPHVKTYENVPFFTLLA